MKIIIQGLWHLGLVHAAGLYKFGHEITCYSENKSEIENLNNNNLPIYEKNLKKILNEGKLKKKIFFKDNIKNFKNINILWYCLDTPINKRGKTNEEYVIKEIKKSLKYFNKIKYLIISSQIPLGTFKLIENFIKRNKIKTKLIYIPENLRLGNSIKNFLRPDRIIVGARSKNEFNIIKKIFNKIRFKLINVSPESAELIKHSINGFLALSICYINEVTKIAKSYNANPSEISKGLKSEERIGYKSYLSPGNAFSGGTLERDVGFLKNISKNKSIKNYIIENILLSNENKKKYIYEKLKKYKKKKIMIVGLSYKEGTSTTRQSDSIKLAKWLKKNMYNFYLHDPNVIQLPKLLKDNHIVNLEDQIPKIDIFIFLYTQTKFKDFDKKIIKFRKNKRTMLYDPCHIFRKNKKIIYL